MNSLIIVTIVISIIILLRGYVIIKESFADTMPIFNQDPYVTCFLIKDEEKCNNDNKLYNFVGSLSKCQWMNDYCGPVRTS
jgi:hypothetical protein